MIGTGEFCGNEASRLLKPGNVARPGKYAGDLAGFVAIDRRIVEHGNGGSVAAPDFKRVIAQKAFQERALISGPRLRRVCEIVGKIRTYEFRPGAAGDRLGGSVQIRDLAVASDGNERIETGFDQPPVVGARRLCVPSPRLRLRGAPLGAGGKFADRQRGDEQGG